MKSQELLRSHGSRRPAAGPQGRPGPGATALPDALAHSPRQVAQREQLQHLFGGASSAGGDVVQRYAIVGGNDYTIGSSGTIFRKHQIARTPYGYHMTRTESVHSRRYGTLIDTTESLNREGGQPNAWRETGTAVAAGLPSLKVSEGGMMALEASGQPSWFYADPAIVVQSNQALARNGADIRLQARAEKITVPSDPEAAHPVADKTLKQVRAVAYSGPNRENLAEHLQCPECNSFINYVMGRGQSARVAVIGFGASEREVLAPSENEPKHAIIKAMTEAHPTPQTVADAADARPKSSFTKQAEKIGIEDAYNEDTRARYTAPSLGTNEFAAPEVGEGLLTVSNKERLADIELDPRHDFRRPAEGENDAYLEALGDLSAADQQVDVMKLAVDDRIKAMKGTWGYHYAGVAAKHGADIVTLENYNRGTENEWEVRRIFNQLFADCRKFREFVWSRTATLSTGKLGEKSRKDLLEAAAKAVEDESLTLTRKYRRAVREAAEAASRPYAGAELIYFQMYGPKAKGQSFHQAFESSTANPLTLRLRNSRDLARQQARAEITARRDTLRDTLAGYAPTHAGVARLIAAVDPDATAAPHLQHVDDADNFGPIQDAAAAGVDALKALARQLALDIGDELHTQVDGFLATATVAEVIAEIDRQAGKRRLFDRAGVKPLMREVKPIVADLKRLAT